MPGTPTTGSTNIALLDLSLTADLCAGKFYLSIVPSIWIGDGKENVLGANFSITNPYGVIVKPYGDNYEIAPDLSGGMDAVISFNVPTQASNYQYGKYTVSVKLYDSDGSSWVNTKTVSVCEPDKNNKTRSYGSLSALMKGSCKDGKVYIITDNVPNYNGKQVESQVNDFTLEYPTGSGLDPLDTEIGSFSVQLYEGVYKFTGTICATYNFTDNVFVNINYRVKKEKNIRCLIDECCVFAKLEELNAKIKTNCTLAEKEESASITVDALLLLKSIELAAYCGEDASDYIEDLEKLLGCVCTCNCAEGTPIINTSPAKDFSITGCNVEKTTVGLTDTYVINAYQYVVGVVDNGGVLVIGTATLNGCIKTQSITFSISAAYTQLKTLITNDTSYWTSLINTTLNSGDVAVFQSILVAITNCCECSAAIGTVTPSQVGADVLLSWTATGEFSVDVYLDGVFKGNVLEGVDEFLLVGAADGQNHDYILLPKCSNNKYGTSGNGTFGYVGCPSISAPVVSSNNVNGVECPYDLTSLESTPPAGITNEWHTANNTNASSLVPDATSVSSGVYYVFAKDSNGCYSTATIVTLICAEATSCTAPQSLSVSHLLLCDFLVQFQSAAFPPPSNSYTVKRRLSSDPDIDGSYTTIGTPTWNSGLNRWVICDGTASNNTLYTWKAISNCGGSPGTTPSTTYEYANIVCPTLTLTPAVDSIGYSFVPAGGGIDKYEVKIYDATGSTLIHTDTFVPSFSNPTTGTFTYLSAGTTYKVRLRVYIGTYYKDCDFVVTATTSENFTLSASYNFSIDAVSGTGVPSLPATGVNGTQVGHHTAMSGNLSIDLSGTIVTTTKIVVSVNYVQAACIAVTGAGNYNLGPVVAAEGDIVTVAVNSGTC